MSNLMCPKCGHDFTPVEASDTRSEKGRREALLDGWFESLKQDNGVTGWRHFINGSGKLKIAPALRALAELDPCCDKKSWGNDDYFKSAGHWTLVYRENFETWVADELPKTPGRDLFGNRTKNDLGLPPWIYADDIEMSDQVFGFIVELAERLKKTTSDARSWEARYNNRGDKILELETQLRNMPARNLAVTEHVNMGSVRTLRIDANYDIDLSLQEIVFGDKQK